MTRDEAKPRAALQLGLLLAGLWLTRLPQLVSSPFLPDGDEALIGLMAKHALAGQGIPFFPWGQRYGFAAPEVTLAAAGFWGFGMSPAVLHAAAFLLWSAGALFLVAALRRLAGARPALIAGVLLAVCPGWFAASRKAWATNVTGFFFTQLATWLLAALAETPGGRGRAARAIALGAAAGLAFWANPFWLTALAPLALLLGWRALRAGDVLAAELGAVAVTAAAIIARSATPGYWAPPLFASPDPVAALRLLPERFWVAMTGTYYLTERAPSGPVTALLAAGWVLATVWALARCLRLALRRQLSRLEGGLALGLAANLACTLAIGGQFAHRYLLPSVACAAVLVGLGLAAALGRGRAAAAAGALLVLGGAWSALEFRRVSPLGYDVQENVSGMRDLLAFLEHERIHDVYCLDPMLQWTIMFTSGENVIARWADPVDRRPDYPRRVDCALAHHERIALVGRVASLPAEMRPRVAVFDGQFFALPDVPEAGLTQAGFRIEPCPSAGGAGRAGGSP